MASLADLSQVPSPRLPSQWQRYVQTVARLGPGQIGHLFARRVLHRALGEGLPVVRLTSRLRGDWAPRVPFLNDPPARTFRPDARSLCIIQIEKTLSDPVDWSPAEMPLLWQLELNYFHWMPRDLSWRRARPWVVDWLDHAPRDPRSICWSPFAVAQRVLRWTRLIRGPWWDEIQDDPAFTRLLRELYAQCRFLVRRQEHELRGNHLLKTALALYAGGRFFEGAEPDRWLRQSRRIIRDELRAQILDDGGHYERSPMYHLMVLVDVVDAFNITPAGDPFAEQLRRPIKWLYQFADSCSHGDGEIPLFNDSVMDQVPCRSDVLRHAEQACDVRPTGARLDFVAHPHFGLFRLGDRRSCLWLDAGETRPPFLLGHTHADTGSFELSVGSHRIICDSGVHSYQDPRRRAWDRSTLAHSTVSIAGESSSDCWGRFRVARRARVRSLAWSDQGTEQCVTLRHDGFRHLPAAPWHERTVEFRAGVYTIRDRVGGRRATDLRCDALLYLGPDVHVQSQEYLSDGGAPRRWSFLVTLASGADLSVRIDVWFDGPVRLCGVFLEPAVFAPKFHTNVPGHCIRAACLANARQLGIDWRLTVGKPSEELIGYNYEIITKLT